MKELKGKRVQSYKLEEGGSKLTIVTKRRKLVYFTEGDCCSESWFESISGDLLNGKVISVEEVEMEDANLKPSRQEVDQIYGYKLILEPEYGSKHRVDIVYRNSSNGYYGGSCELVSNNPLET